MKILVFSDVHQDIEAAGKLVAMSREVDAVVGAGDFCVIHEGLGSTIGALGAIQVPTVLVCGNNETQAELRDAVKDWEAAVVLHGEGAGVAGIPFYGLGGGIPPTPWDWSYDLTEDEARQALEDCPTGSVLALHSPPSGHLDGAAGQHLGSEAILEAIKRKQPTLAICGHVHECWGQEARIGDTVLVNAGPAGRIIEI